jgi:hypothetical protein
MRRFDEALLLEKSCCSGQSIDRCGREVPQTALVRVPGYYQNKGHLRTSGSTGNGRDSVSFVRVYSRPFVVQKFRLFASVRGWIHSWSAGVLVTLAVSPRPNLAGRYISTTLVDGTVASPAKRTRLR